jgi:SagB-type dehydrogenase family enzyme
MGLWQTIAERRSVRDYRRQPLSLTDLAQLLWATQGITAREAGFEFRAAPSAGALYPCETYLVVNRVQDLQSGVYHLAVLEAQLELLKPGDFARDIAAACGDQGMCAAAAVVFAWTAVCRRSKWKYGERAYRYMYLDAGHIGAQLHLAAVALGLGCCAIGAFFDDEVNEVLGVDGEGETAVYLSSIGKL